jgi:hypothetical protein
MVTTERFMHKGRQWTKHIEDPYECWVMGVDLGQRNDYTVVSAIEHTRTPLDEWDVDEDKATTRQKVEERFAVRGLQRFTLGMDYTTQAERIRSLLLAPPINGQADLVLDDAGVGAPVGDQVTTHGKLHPVRVTLTGTGTEVTRHAHRKYTVPKLTLVSHLDARLNTRELIFAEDLDARQEIKDEMINFQRHVTSAGRSTFEARASKHDDIVASVGFSLWWCIYKRHINRGKTGSLVGLY